MIRKSLLLLLAVALALLLAAPAWANGTTVLKPVGPENVTVGEEFTVGIVVYDVEGLAGCQLRLDV